MSNDVKLKFGLPVRWEGMNNFDCRDVYTFWDDFLDSSMSATVDVARWKTTLLKAALVPALLDGTDASQELAGGIVVVNPGATDSAVSNMYVNGEAFQIASGHELYFEARFMLTSTGVASFVGLSDFSATALTVTVSNILAPGNCIGFMTAATVFNTHVAKSTLNTDAITGVTVTANTWYRVAFHYDGATGVTFYMTTSDGELKVVNKLHLTTTAHYIPDDIMLTPTIEAETTDGAGGLMYVDYVLCQQARQRVAD